MRYRIVVGAVAASLVTFMGRPASAQEQTAWRKVDRSLGTLLDQGWRIESMSHVQLFKREGMRETNVAGTFSALALASVPIGLEYNFLLSKNGKWVVCIVTDPELDTATSRCRSLN